MAGRFTSRLGGRRDLAIVAGAGSVLLALTVVAPATAHQSDNTDPSVRSLLDPVVGKEKPAPAPQPAPEPAQPAPAAAPPAAAPPAAPAQPAAQPAAQSQDTYEEGSMEMSVPLMAPDPLVPNLVRNGSFEDPGAPQTGFVGTFDAIPGWTETTGRGMEIQNQLYSPPERGGAQYAELASDAPSNFFQDVPTEPGTTYRLSFLYSANPNGGLHGSAFDVTFGTSTMRLDPAAAATSYWRQTVIEVTATSATTRLNFAGTPQEGQDPGIGALLDLVEVRRLG